MKSDKWITKLVRILKQCGFKEKTTKGNTHRKFVLEDDDLERPCIVVLQAKMKSYSRLDALSEIKRNLRNSGANQSVLSRFDNIALGFILEEGNIVNDLDEILFNAIKSNDISASIHAAFKLGRETTTSLEALQCFTRIDSEHETRRNIQNAILDIEKILSEMFEVALQVQLKRHSIIDFSSNRLIKGFLDTDILNRFCLKMGIPRFEGSQLFVELSYKSEIRECFNKVDQSVYFEAIFSAEEGDSRKYYSTSRFEGIQIIASKMDDQKAWFALRDQIENIRMLIFLQGRE